MNILKLITHVLLVTTIAGCSSGYRVSGDKMEYHFFNGSGMSKFSQRIDRDSFVIISRGFAKDKDIVFFEGLAIEHGDADSASFKVINGSVSKDKHNVYYGRRIVKNADAATFQHLENSYYKDKRYLYFGFILDPVEACDVNSLVAYKNSRYSATDDKCYYYFGKVVPIKDRKTFKVLHNDYAKDKNDVYFKGKILKDADPQSFKQIGYKNKLNSQWYYTKDKNSCFYGSKRGSCKNITDFINNILRE